MIPRNNPAGRQGEVITWNPSFRRNPQVISWYSFSSSRQKISGRGEDKVLWEGEKNKVFLVRSFYQKMINNDGSFPWRNVWKTKAPAIVTFFMLEAVNEALLTGDNLRIRNKIYVNWCFICKADEGNVNHLLLHYLDIISETCLTNAKPSSLPISQNHNLL